MEGDDGPAERQLRGELKVECTGMGAGLRGELKVQCTGMGAGLTWKANCNFWGEITSKGLGCNISQLRLWKLGKASLTRIRGSCQRGCEGARGASSV